MDLGSLREAVSSIPEGAWSLPSSYRKTKVHHGYRQVSLAENGKLYEVGIPFRHVLSSFTPVRTAWLSWIEPKGFIVPHRDAGPWFERWQIPIHTSGEMNGTTPQDGAPFEVHHWEIHSVWNTGNRPRIHLVLDRDVVVDGTKTEFTTYPIPADKAWMVKEVS